ncbi:hypothetical protein LR393_27700 [Kineosporia mesophila]|nr:hypothetical protein [Kineosporia mesophila]MCD5353865.1 hypothetical protein [Kineosporia mesophila]
MPVPLRPGDMRDGDRLDLNLSPEDQEHLFAFEPGAPLPARTRRPKPQSEQPGEHPLAGADVPPVTGAESIISSATVISPVSGTYLVSSSPIAAEARRQEEARRAMVDGTPAQPPRAQPTHTQIPHTQPPQAAAPGEYGPSFPNDYRTEQGYRAARSGAQPAAPRVPDPAPRSQPQQLVHGTARPAPVDPGRPGGYAGYDGTGYGTPPSASPGSPERAPARVSPNTEPIDLRHVRAQAQPATRSAPEGALRRRTDQSADWYPARTAERQAESIPDGSAVSPARRPLGSGSGDRPGTALQLRSPHTSLQGRKEDNVTNIDIVLKEAMQIDGAVGVALVDYTSGMTLGQAGGGSLNLEVAAAGNTEVVRSKLRTMEALGLREGIEDILITLDTQYHLIRLITDQSGIGLFLYLALDKHRSNLALARRKLANLERTIEI